MNIMLDPKIRGNFRCVFQPLPNKFNYFSALKPTQHAFKDKSCTNSL